MGIPRGEEFWRRVVAEAEGKSATQIAAKHGVSLCSVLRWRQRLREEHAPALVPVRVAAAPASRRLELRVGEAHVAFEEGTDPTYVAAVARALGA